MREAFQKHFPDITPSFLEIFDDSDNSIERVETNLNYPVIIKPTNLFSSFLIQACSNHNELKIAATNLFLYIASTYSREGINEEPRAIVEEFLEGDFYSTDIFVMENDNICYCPLVGYIPAKQLGVDDFFLYKRFIPANLSDVDTKEAFRVTKDAVSAVGLTHSAAHVELIKTRGGWKVIELGPRLGRFRNSMYALGYGIDMSLNDINVHLGIKPEIPSKLLQQCSAYSIYPRKEGTLRSVQGTEELKNSSLVKSLRILSKPGDRCLFAKNGGGALAEFIIASNNESSYTDMVNFIEQNVYADIDDGIK
jgi:biotin carboxylase